MFLTDQSARMDDEEWRQKIANSLTVYSHSVMSKWKRAAGWVVRNLSMIKHRRTQKEENKLLRPLFDKQVLRHPAKTPFEPTPTLSFATLQLTRVRK